MKRSIAVLCMASSFFLFGFQQKEEVLKQMHGINNTVTKAAPLFHLDTAKVKSHFYLSGFSYTAETWARLTKNPEDRRLAARKIIEAVGGKLHGFWYAFGTYDGYCIWEAPDNISMAAVSLAISGSGALSKFETTPLITVEETLDALQRTQKVGYRPPGKQ